MSDDERRRRIECWALLVLSILAAVGATIGSLVLAGSSFASTPRLTRSGVIGVGIDSTRPGDFAPLRVDVRFDGAIDGRRTDLAIAVGNKPDAAAPANKSTPVLLFLCGKLKQSPSLVDEAGHPMVWSPVPDGQLVDFVSSLGSPLADCVFTRLTLRWELGGLSMRLIRGSVAPRMVSVSGKRVLYVLPTVSEMPPIPLDDLDLRPPPVGSVATVGLTGQPGDLIAGVASPQLPDAGTLEWPIELGHDNTRLDRRLSGELADRDSTQQRDLFMAGALAGVAGGAVLLALEALVRLLLDTSLLPGRPSSSTTPPSVRPAAPPAASSAPPAAPAASAAADFRTAPAGPPAATARDGQLASSWHTAWAGRAAAGGALGLVVLLRRLIRRR